MKTSTAIRKLIDRGVTLDEVVSAYSQYYKYSPIILELFNEKLMGLLKEKEVTTTILTAIKGNPVDVVVYDISVKTKIRKILKYLANKFS